MCCKGKMDWYWNISNANDSYKSNMFRCVTGTLQNYKEWCVMQQGKVCKSAVEEELQFGMRGVVRCTVVNADWVTFNQLRNDGKGGNIVCRRRWHGNVSPPGFRHVLAEEWKDIRRGAASSLREVARSHQSQSRGHTFLPRLCITLGPP